MSKNSEIDELTENASPVPSLSVPPVPADAREGLPEAASRRKTKAPETSFLDDLVAETPVLLARLDAPRPEDAPVPHLPISDIAPDPRQPRRHIDEVKLLDLAADIKKTGILQPLVVRPAPDWNGYVLVFGERRYRAALKAGLKHVPAFIRRDLSDADVLHLQWQENAQREDIDDIDKALHLKRMKEIQKLSWTQLAERVHLTRRHLLRMQHLADMPETVTNLVRERRLTPSHVYQIARLDDPVRQAKFAAEAAENGWSVSRLNKAIHADREEDVVARTILTNIICTPGVAGDIDVTSNTRDAAVAGVREAQDNQKETAQPQTDAADSERDIVWEPVLDTLRERIASDTPITERERKAFQQIAELAAALASRHSA